MKMEKQFDCVEMKQRVQEQVRRQYSGMKEEEALRLQEHAALNDPLLGPFLAKVRSRGSARREPMRSKPDR